MVFVKKNGWLSTTDVTKKNVGFYFAWVILIIIFVEYSIPQKTSKLVVELYINVITRVFVLWRWGPQGKGFNEETQHGPVTGPVFEKNLHKQELLDDPLSHANTWYHVTKWVCLKMKEPIHISWKWLFSVGNYHFFKGGHPHMSHLQYQHVRLDNHHWKLP